MFSKIWTILCCLLLSQTDAAKILAIFASQSASHYILVTPLLKSLAQRGHEITAITPFPQGQPLKNYRDITVLKDYNEFNDRVNDDQVISAMSIWQLFDLLYVVSTGMANSVMQQQEIRELMRNKVENFDLIIADVCVDEALFGFAAHFDAPIIGVAPFGAHIWNTDLTGAPNLPSYMPYHLFGYGDEMNFLQRMHNFYAYTAEYLFYNLKYLPKHREIFAQYFAYTGRTLDDVRRNFSLILLNQHFTLGARRPHVPNMIEVGGMQVSRTVNPLPTDIQQFLDEASAGAIYFSLGSNIKSENLAKEKLNAILNAFRVLPLRVLWKFEVTDLKNKPANVMISSWFPQSDVLAHPNVKLFITHGGLLSITEAIARAKPLLGIPFFADQYMNVERARRSGFALALSYNDISEANFRGTIEKLLRNASYARMAQTVSQRFHDKPQSALDTAIYWVEYVLRHRGASHMRCPGLDLNFLQYYGLDVMALVLLVLVMLFGLAISLLRWSYQSLRYTENPKVKKQ